MRHCFSPICIMLTAILTLSSCLSNDDNDDTTYYDDTGDQYGTQIETKQTNADGSSTATTTDYNADGDPTKQVNEEVDVDGNAST